jgi:spermidine synthase
MKKWETIARARTREGELALRRRGDDEFLIVIDGRVLMTSAARRSEETLARLACDGTTLRVLIGGLGMGYTLRAALDALPAGARLTVAEITPEIVNWCRGPMAVLTAAAIEDPRVSVEIDDVAQVIAGARAEYDAIVLDLYEGPNASTQGENDPFYSSTALARARSALRPGGRLAIWSEDADPAFERRFTRAGFEVSTHREPRGAGGRRHFVYLGRCPREPR